MPPSFQGRGVGDIFHDVPHLMDAGGEAYSLARRCGDVVLLAVGGQWCPPCREEMPRLAELHAELDEEGLAVVFVLAQDAAGAPATRADVVQWETEFGPPFPVVADAGDRVKGAYAPDLAWPVTIVLDRRFVIRSVQADAGVEEVRPVLDRLLAE